MDSTGTLEKQFILPLLEQGKAGPVELLPFVDIFNPSRSAEVRQILRILEYDQFDGEIVVDASLPAHIGGYLAEDGNKQRIAINPIHLLFGTYLQVAHILTHEGVHAGLYSEKGIKDESLTEFTTKQIMQERFGGTDTITGYDELVRAFEAYFPGMSAEDVLGIFDGEDTQELDRLIEVLLLEPVLAEGNIDWLSWERLEQRKGEKWSILTQLFPRLMNERKHGKASSDMETDMGARDYSLDGLLERAAERIVSDVRLIEKVLGPLLKANPSPSIGDVYSYLKHKGLLYLWDYQQTTILESVFGSSVSTEV